jgi:DNA-binding transcriptional LysR family regulator
MGVRENAPQRRARRGWAACLDDDGMVIDAALAGVGLAYLIEDQVASLLRAGALTRVLEDWCPPFPGFRSRRCSDARLTSLFPCAGVVDFQTPHSPHFLNAPCRRIWKGVLAA